MSHHRRRRAALAGATVALTAVAMPGAASAADANPRGLLDGVLPSLPIVPSLPVVSTLPLVGGGTTTGVTDVASLTSLLDVLTAPLASGGLPGAGALPIPGLSALGGGSTGGSDPLAALTALVPGLNALTAGLPVGGLPTGMVPTGASLAPATALLRQLAAAAAGTPLASALTSLADQVDAAGAGGVSPDLLGVLAATLDSAANTPGVPAPVADAAKQAAAALKPAAPAGSTTKPPASTTPTSPVMLVPAPTASSPAPGAAAPTAKPVGKARITSVRVDRKHGRVRVAMACPASGPTCKSIVSAARGSALGTSTILMTVGAGKTSARNLKLTSASRKAIKKRTTKFTVAAIRPGGSLSRRTATTRVPKKHKSHKSHKSHR